MEGFSVPNCLCSLFSIIIISDAVDTITKTEFLKDGETKVSASGSFELGFFSPGNSSNRYVGIWYKKVASGTVEWVANRETPLAATSGVLKVVDPGILVLVDGTNGTIWSTNTSTTANSPAVQLLESGNLVVKDLEGDSPRDVLWQSFDYPGDTFLPGMKLGKNLVTGQEWYLSSWKSKDDPSQGEFTYGLDLLGYPQIVLRKGSTELFRSGPWNGIRFSRPQLTPNPIYKYQVVFEKDEVYYRYELLNSTLISKFILTPDGVGQRWTWIDQTKGWTLYLTLPTDTCDTYKLCGPYVKFPNSYNHFN